MGLVPRALGRRGSGAAPRRSINPHLPFLVTTAAPRWKSSTPPVSKRGSIAIFPRESR